VAFHGEIYKLINFIKIPLAEIYCLIYENFHVAYADRIGESNIGATSVYGGVELGGVAVLPALISWRIGRGSSETAEASCLRGLETISTPRRNGWGPDGSLIRQDIRGLRMLKSYGKSLIVG
jgi:hypothetical protein